MLDQTKSRSTQTFMNVASSQAKLSAIMEYIEGDPLTPHTIVAVPSFPISETTVANAPAFLHYEERLLTVLQHLRRPHCNIVYVTSEPLNPVILDHYLGFLTGVSRRHAENRLTLLDCNDGSPKTLSAKILERPPLISRLRNLAPASQYSWIETLVNGAPEQALSTALNIPIAANDPSLSHLGTKSSSRKIFRQLGVKAPAGFEDLKDRKDIVSALSNLKVDTPDLRRAVLKLDEGIAGQGNGVFSFDGCDATSTQGVSQWIDNHLHEVAFQAPSQNINTFLEMMNDNGGVAEAFIEGNPKHSPSSQAMIAMNGDVYPTATHDQVFPENNSQIFEGCIFPAESAYRNEIQNIGVKIGEALASEGARGPFGVDFVVVQDTDGAWEPYAIEINLRVTATEISRNFLKFLTGAKYDSASGFYLSKDNAKQFYYAVDTIVDDAHRGVTPTDILDLIIENDLNYDAAKGNGVLVHTIGALSRYGAMGMVCVGKDPDECRELYNNTRRTISRQFTERQR